MTLDPRTHIINIGNMKLEGGGRLEQVDIAYTDHGPRPGDPNYKGTILIFHAMTGSQHIAGEDTSGPSGNRFWTEKMHRGWFDVFVGPHDPDDENAFKAVDTNKYRVICANYLGGCYGSTGPASTNPKTGKPYGSSFPNITISDIVDSQVALLEKLNIDEKLLCVIGPSLGGFCALDMSVRYPYMMQSVNLIATALQPSSMLKANLSTQIWNIHDDPNFNDGDYYDSGYPYRGLAKARAAMAPFFESKYDNGRAKSMVKPATRYLAGLPVNTAQISRHAYEAEGRFAEAFDPNAYMHICQAFDSFSLPEIMKKHALKNSNGASDRLDIENMFSDKGVLIFSFDNDTCFAADDTVDMVRFFTKNNVKFDKFSAHDFYGHDSFLIESELSMFNTIVPRFLVVNARELQVIGSKNTGEAPRIAAK